MKVYQNTSENGLAELVRARGWTLTKRGWPDFWCVKGDRLIVIECKPWSERCNRFRRLRKDQADCLDLLARHGIECFISDGVRLERYDRSAHFPEPYSRRK